MDTTTQAETTTAATTIMSIEITEGAQEWGCEVTKAQDDAMHERYEAAVAKALAAAYPDAEITHTINRRDGRSADVWITSGGPGRFVNTAGSDVDDVRELLGQAWVDTCEGSADLFE